MRGQREARKGKERSRGGWWGGVEGTNEKEQSARLQTLRKERERESHRERETERKEERLKGRAKRDGNPHAKRRRRKQEEEKRE